MTTLYHGDCLIEMSKIADKSIDMILCDPPFGTISCKWDTVIPFAELWKQYERIISDKGAIVLFCQQPFTSTLICSNLTMFKYMWYWRKSRPSGYVNAKLKPMKDIEEIAVFSKGTTANKSMNNMNYFPQDLVEVNKKWKRPKQYFTDGGVNSTRLSMTLEKTIKFEGYPRQVLDYSQHNGNQLHPTQKPVPLMEYLIKTYTNENATVLDNCMGSGTAGIASKNLNRNFIGIEKDETYFNIAKNRIEQA